MDEGMNAFGKEIPNFRIEAAMRWLETDFPNKGPVQRGYILGCALRGITQDRPQSIFDDLKHVLDTTGIYRLVAILCSEPDPEEKVEKTTVKECSCTTTRTIIKGVCNKCGGVTLW